MRFAGSVGAWPPPRPTSLLDAWASNAAKSDEAEARASSAVRSCRCRMIVGSSFSERRSRTQTRQARALSLSAAVSAGSTCEDANGSNDVPVLLDQTFAAGPYPVRNVFNELTLDHARNSGARRYSRSCGVLFVDGDAAPGRYLRRPPRTVGLLQACRSRPNAEAA